MNNDSTAQKPHTITIVNDVLIPELTQLINQGHSITLPLRGNSMRPFLKDGRDKALLKATDKPQVGDAVLAEIKPSVWVLHRIIKIEGNNVTLRGDGNLSNEYCKTGDIKAKAVAFYRKGKDTPDTVDGMKWKAYSWAWTRLYPIRRYLLFIYRHLA